MIRRELILLFSFFAAVSFFLPGCAAMAGGKNTLTSALKNLESKNKPVYFVHIFDGAFPIPTRFEIQPSGYKKTGNLRFTSPSIPLVKSADVNGGGVDKVGAIRIGTGSNFINTYWKGANKADMKNFECYGLSIEVEASPNMRMENGHGGNARFTDVLIHNDSQYVSVTGTDKSLWKQLLSVYGALSEKKAGPDCLGMRGKSGTYR